MTSGKRHRPRKRFGQHFLRDQGVVDRIVRVAVAPDSVALVEIGPGLGALTLPLLRELGHLHAVELDRDLIEPLARRAAALGKLTIHQGDALAFDFAALSETLGKPLRLIGNLPYNISTPFLFHLFAQRACIESMHFMLQKDVVERLAASSAEKAYGRLGIMAQYHCRVLPLFEVHPNCFDPPPRVDSAVVSLQPHDSPPWDVGDFSNFQWVVTAAFSARRKTLRNALAGVLDETRIRAAGVDPGSRAERVTPESYAALSRQLLQA